MSLDSSSKAFGSVREISGESVSEIGNGSITRRIHSVSGHIGTTSLVNTVSAKEYLDETSVEFEITIEREGGSTVLTSQDFGLKGHEMQTWDDEKRTLALKLEAGLDGRVLPVTVFYEARAGEDFLRKWIEVGPCDAEGWVVRNVVIESLRLSQQVQGVTPTSRYLLQYDDREDRVHSEPDKVNALEPENRFSFTDYARSLVTRSEHGEGVYFFTESLLGKEAFDRPTGLVMSQRDYVPLSQGLTTGAAVIGAYSGSPEVGFKRYTQHLLNHWCCVKGKKLPVSWSTWLITLEGNKALCGSYDRDLLLEYIEYVKEAGFFDILHLDLGWEADYPMKVDAAKFPNGMIEVSKRAKEAANLDMTYWVNPFSASYWRSQLQDEHPDWLVPGEVSGRSGATAICPITEYSDYVKKRYVELATELNARVIYWDGNDWKIRECSATNHGHSDQEELEVKAWKRMAEICSAAHEAREDLMFVVFSIPFDNHRLCVLDQEQISDTYSFPTVQSELIQRQQLYQCTWEHPYLAIWGSWYGINWHNAGEANLFDRPMRELVHAEMSMIGNGIAQAGGGFDFKQAPPEFMAFLKKLFAFRKRFEDCFNSYQHVLGFPDGTKIDGEGHLVGERGFIVLVNPTNETLSVRVPLAEPELELSADKKHELTDWTGMESASPMGSFAIDDAPEIGMQPLEVRYIGVNIAE